MKSLPNNHIKMKGIPISKQGVLMLPLLHIAILTHFFLLVIKQKIKHLQFQIRTLHGIRRSSHPLSSQSDTSFVRYGTLSVEVRGKSTFGDGSTIIANFYSFEKPLQSATQGAPDNLCPENFYLVYCQWLH